MKRTALFVVAAATILAACSDSTELRRSPEEQVLFILTGLTKSVDFNTADDIAVTTAVSGEFPLRVHLSEVARGFRYRGTDFTVERRRGCMFGFRRASGPTPDSRERQAEITSGEFRHAVKSGAIDVFTGARGLGDVAEELGTRFVSMQTNRGLGWLSKPQQRNRLGASILEVSADLSGLTAVSYIDASTIHLDGAKLRCIGEGSSCAALQGNLDKGLWSFRSQPFGMDDANKRAAADAALGRAVKVLVSNSCQPT